MGLFLSYFHHSFTILIFFLLLGLTHPLLPDPNYDELMREDEESSKKSNLEGATAEARASGCHLKESFQGSWFQSGIFHAITVTKDAISTKGHCVEREGDNKYLFYNKRANCYRCLVITEKHRNVLQYKETFCIPEKRSLKSLCSLITGDANLYALFRLGSTPVQCPFQGGFTLTYNRGHGDCAHPPSSLTSCTRDSKLLFQFQACPDIPGSESGVEELECLAQWKEGSLRFFLGLVNYEHQHHASYEERFRCFVYERTKFWGRHHGHHGHHLRGGGDGRVVREGGSGGNSSMEQYFKVAMSGDATCNGLSSMEGSRTMAIRRGTSTYSSSSCQFPSWLTTTIFHTLDSHTTLTFTQNTVGVSNWVWNIPNNNGVQQNITMKATCHQVIEDEEENGKDPPTTASSGTSVLVILQATIDCKSGFLCTLVHKRDGDILEVQWGRLSKREEEACETPNFNPGEEDYVTLVKSSPTKPLRVPVECPLLPGQFQELHGSASCSSVKMSIRCSQEHSITLSKSDDERDSSDCDNSNDKFQNSMEFSTSALNFPSSSTTPLHLHCLTSWTDQDTTFTIVSSSSSSSLLCLTFTKDTTLAHHPHHQLLKISLHSDTCRRETSSTNQPHQKHLLMERIDHSCPSDAAGVQDYSSSSSSSGGASALPLNQHFHFHSGLDGRTRMMIIMTVIIRNVILS